VLSPLSLSLTHTERERENTENRLTRLKKKKKRNSVSCDNMDKPRRHLEENKPDTEKTNTA
jgi:hypothetical protein